MAESPRPSRQDLVVSPRGSNFPLVLGSLVCAGAGFGLVWSLGIGRTGGMVTLPFATHATAPDGSLPSASGGPADASHTAVEESHVPRTFADDPSPGTPGRFPVVDAAEVAPAGRRGWSQPASPAAAAPADPRYPARPATLEVPDDARQIDPAGAMPEGTSPERAMPEPRFAPVPAGASAGVRPTSFRSSTPDRGSRFAPDAGAATDGVVTAGREVEADPADAPVGQPVDHTDVGPPAGADASQFAASAPEAAGPTPDDAGPVAAESDPAAAQVAVSADGSGPPPSAAQDPPFAAPAAADTVPVAPAVASVASQTAPAAATVGVPAVTSSPFAAAPPMGPPPAASPDRFRGGDALPSSAGPAFAGEATAGQGRPGPAQLEGAQTPQLVVEKRGPREIQVGKAVRYEISVRNVGTATAQDVTLRDAVPFGTTLVATTPPATPAAGLAELVWPLGALPPGGETKVAMEVMPQIEGDIGSVASVSFRAEASLRSRATKPDLRLELTPTRPVRIGGDVPLSLKVSNPGTGVATGVVLEGILPDGVSHRAGRDLEFDVGQLRPGESRSIDLVLGTSGPGVHQARFTARADGRIEVEQAARIEITAPTLELQVEMPSRRYLQRPATCVLSMVNAGTASARAVELAAQLPPGLKFVRANHAGWYDERTHRVLWSLEELPPGEVGTVEAVLMPVDLGPQKIVAAARSTDGPSHQASHIVDVEGLAALFFEVTDSEDPIEVGGVTEYIVRVRNQGTKAAGGVRITASLLGDLEPIDAKGPSAHRVENLSFLFEPLARLSPAEEAVYRLRVRGRRAGDQRVQVQVVSDDLPAPTTKEEITRVYADR